MLSYAECERIVATARDKRSKPVANNTRVEKRGEHAYALRLHATDIATYQDDGHTFVSSGGYRTVTTADRLRGYVTRALSSERGTWYMDLAPDPNDPRPERGSRTVPKPFHALDPGPEPVRDDEDPAHVAGQVHAVPYSEEVLVSKREIEHGVWDSASIVRETEHSPDYFVGYAIKRGLDVTYYGEHQGSWSVPGFREAIDEQHGSLSINDRAHYAQCPHCKTFTARHDAWRIAMHGERWGRNRTLGYAKMRQMLDEYGTREAWQDAYLDDFRAAREANAIHKAWVERNRTPFEDGMEIDANGYALRPDPKEIKRIMREQKRIAKQRERIDKFVDGAVEALAKGMPMPGGGDCWGCAFRADDVTIEPMGVDHLWEHIKERYYVPSMFANAYRARGMQPAGVYMMLHMNQDTGRMGGERIDRSEVRRVLRRYLYQRLVREHAVR